LEIGSRRIKQLNRVHLQEGPVVYWMSRDQRASDNWALLYASELALKNKAALGVAFCLQRGFLGAAFRQYEFMLAGLEQVEKTLTRYNIPIFLLTGDPVVVLPDFIRRKKIKAIIADFSPLKICRKWRNDIAEIIPVPFYEVDAHNIVPVWESSPKLEYGAYTIRPKINRLLPQYLEDFPSLRKHKYPWPNDIKRIDWQKAHKFVKADTAPMPIDWLKSGEKNAINVMYDFFEKGLRNYIDKRNDPAQAAQSNLSPYLHFGQLSAQRVAFEARRYDNDIKSQEVFLDELIIRRELADNFCYYNNNYDNYEGFPEWAKKTFEFHLYDKREYIYSTDELERGLTHDPLWNAAEMEMIYTGKMHGFMRMYWAKKILEWSETPQEALATAIYLNDKYELDGRDPNGYAGIAWSIGGVHDRAWPERPIFGKIRYMNYAGCLRKFAVNAYIDKIKKIVDEYKR